MKTLKLSVVIVTWNTCDLTSRCLQTLLACRSLSTTEVIVVDNASEDDTVEMIRSEHPGVRLIVNDDNRLYSEANNQGVEASSGRYVCILNSDTEVRPGALERLMEFLDHHEDYSVVGPKLVNPDGTAQQSCNRFYGLLEDLLHESWLGKFPPGSGYLRRANLLDFDFQSSRDVQQIMGACLMFRRSDYLDMNGFDPALSLYFNDHDLCRRFLAKGSKSRFLAESEVLHHRGVSANKLEDLNIYWNINRLTYLRKHNGWWGGFQGRGLHRLKALKISLKILLGPRSIQQKRVAIADLRAKTREILAA